MNPYLPTWEYIPDGEPRVFGNRIYIYGSHDKFGGNAFCMNDYVCWSAPLSDLKNWRNDGVIFRRADDPTPVGRWQNYMWAPDCIQGPDGRYYLYYAMEWLNRIGVAVCDAPAGKFKFYGEVRYNDGTRFGGRPKEPIRFDPGLLNDGGRIFLYTGFSNKWMRGIARRQNITITDLGNTVVELEDDMLTVKGEPKPLLPGLGNAKGTGFEGHEFFEASSMRKFDSTYYAVYSSVKCRELCYATSRYPDRDFKYGGVLLDNGNVFGGSAPTFYYGNNHGSLAKIGDDFYIFGHRQTGRSEFSRQGIAQKIEFKNGAFLQAEMTSCGVQPYLECKGSYEAGIACVLNKGGVAKGTGTKFFRPYITQDGPDREHSPAQYIANFSNGCICGYKYFKIPPRAMLILNVRPHKKSRVRGEIAVCLDKDGKKAVSRMVDISSPSVIRFELKGGGVLPLYIKFAGRGALDLLSLGWQ